MATTDTVTVLFTSLGEKGELLARPNVMSRQTHLFETLVANAVATCGGREAQWLGDGIMAMFESAGDAVRCAICVQQTGRRASAGRQFGVRVGLHVGEMPRGKSGSYGIPLPKARGLCERAASGQILCSKVIAGLLSEQGDFKFRDLPEIELQQGAPPIAVCEVAYTLDRPTVLLHRPPFVGRSAELSMLENALTKAKTGQGGLVMLVGEPGIGKTRMIEEFTEVAQGEEALVLWGRCYEGEWAPPFGPFAEAMTDYVRRAEAEQLRRDLGFGAPPLSRLVPTIRVQLPDVMEPEALQADEERFRLLDAVSQFLIAVSARQPVVLVLDDLHWADKGTIAMLRHLARFVGRSHILVVGAYRDVELDRQHPLAESLGALRRESNYERIVLRGLGGAEIAQLLETMAEGDVPERLVNAIGTETAGNPFFIREVLLHLVEEDKLFHADGRWTSKLAIEEMGIPESVRQVVGRRLSRLSPEANRFLTAASAFNGTFPFQLAAAVAGLNNEGALSALDEALKAQLIRSATAGDSYEFTHALIQHTLYTELNPSRQVRIHRQVAEEMEHLWGNRSNEHAAELAYQFSRSAALRGAERGGDYAIVAADQAEEAYAYDEVAGLIRIALDLLPFNDRRRPRLLGRLGIALTWTLSFDEALKAAREAGELIAKSEGEEAAASYILEAVVAADIGGFVHGAWELAKDGLRYSGDRRDLAWARFASMDIWREEAEDPNNPALTVDSPRFREVIEVVRHLPAEQLRGTIFLLRPSSRAEVIGDPGAQPGELTFRAGEYRRSLPLVQQESVRCEKKGQIARAVTKWAHVARCHTALGELEAARTAIDHATALSMRLPSVHRMDLLAANHEMRIATDEEWQKAIPDSSPLLEQPENKWALGAIRAATAYVLARLDHPDEALRLIATLPAALELTNAVASEVYTPTACDAADTLWLLGCSDHTEFIERTLREKVFGPDFRWPMRDARLSIARLCALQKRYGEAIDWFAKARIVLEEQGARPLRAIADFDEALMYARRNAAGDGARARPLLEAAIAQFQSIGMTGWLRRAEALTDELETAPPDPAVWSDHARGEPDVENVFRREADYWTVSYEGKTWRLKDAKGLSYIAHLLAHPGEEIRVLDLVSHIGGGVEVVDDAGAEDLARSGALLGDLGHAGEMIDEQAKGEYQHRLQELEDELQEARDLGNEERIAKVEDEREAVAHELRRAIGLAGRDRRAASSTERARVAVTRAIRLSLERISKQDRKLGKVLSTTIKTGTVCSYVPDERFPISWRL